MFEALNPKFHLVRTMPSPFGDTKYYHSDVFGEAIISPSVKDDKPKLKFMSNVHLDILFSDEKPENILNLMEGLWQKDGHLCEIWTEAHFRTSIRMAKDNTGYIYRGIAGRTHFSAKDILRNMEIMVFRDHLRFSDDVFLVRHLHHGITIEIYESGFHVQYDIIDNFNPHDILDKYENFIKTDIDGKKAVESFRDYRAAYLSAVGNKIYSPNPHMDIKFYFCLDSLEIIIQHTFGAMHFDSLDELFASSPESRAKYDIAEFENLCAKQAFDF